MPAAHPRATALLERILLVEGPTLGHRAPIHPATTSNPWPHLPIFLTTGRALPGLDDPRSRAALHRQLAAPQAGRTRPSAARLAAHLGPAAGPILDVGAGSAVWSLAMLADGGAATALDLPGVVEAVPSRPGLTPLAGDHHALPPGPWARVVLANLLHLETREEAAALVHRAAAVLARGGELVVVDAFTDDTERARRIRAVYALHLALRTDRGAAWDASTVDGWARDAGLELADQLRFEELLPSGARIYR